MTGRDKEILATLCVQARYFSLEQIAREWWPGTEKGIRLARKRMLKLAGDDWVRSVRVFARPLVVMETPVLEWAPLEPTPDYSATSRILRRRWKWPARETEIILSAAKARALFGGKVAGVVKNLCQTTHDLHVSEIFLRYRRILAGRPEAWVGEDEIASLSRGGTIPDACLRNLDGGVLRVIEFGGSYSAGRVADFHDFCSTMQFPYEMW